MAVSNFFNFIVISSWFTKPVDWLILLKCFSIDFTYRYENMSVTFGRVRQSWNYGRMKGSINFFDFSNDPCFTFPLLFFVFYFKKVSTFSAFVFNNKLFKSYFETLNEENGFKYLIKISNYTLTFYGMLPEMFLNIWINLS